MVRLVQQGKMEVNFVVERKSSGIIPLAVAVDRNISTPATGGHGPVL